MPVFPSIEGEPALDKLFRRFPHTAPPLLEYHDRLLRDPSPLTVAERELIAAYVSGLNACTYCHGAHRVAAGVFGVEEALFDTLIGDLEKSAVDARLKPILAYVRKLTLTPARMVEADAVAVFDAGWDEQALFDAISVCALFNFMNRIVEGSGIRHNPLQETEAELVDRRTRMAALGDDANSAPHSYSRLLELWGIARVHDGTDAGRPRKSTYVQVEGSNMSITTKFEAGATFPDFSWQSVADEAVTPASASGWRLLVIYRGKHCPLCKQYLTTLNGMQKDFAEAGISVWALSSDPLDRAKEEASQNGWTLPILAGLSEDEMRTVGLYISSPRSPEETDRNFAEPATFVINPDGKVQIVEVSNAPFARPDLKGLLDGIRFVMAKNYPVRGIAG